MSETDDKELARFEELEKLGYNLENASVNGPPIGETELLLENCTVEPTRWRIRVGDTTLLTIVAIQSEVEPRQDEFRVIFNKAWLRAKVSTADFPPYRCSYEETLEDVERFFKRLDLVVPTVRETVG